MSKLLLTSAALVAFAASPVLAAKAPAIVPIYNWTGIYIGTNIGGSFGHASTDWTIAGAPV